MHYKAQQLSPHLITRRYQIHTQDITLEVLYMFIKIYQAL